MAYQNSRQGNRNDAGRPKPKEFQGLTEENYVDLAEQAIRNLKNAVDDRGRSIGLLTTSQIRNLLAMTADIYNEAVNSPSKMLQRETIERISYLRLRFVYEAGREPKVKAFVEKTNVLEYLKKIGTSKEKYIRFSRYMEALVAYHRYLGGRDS